MSRNRKSGRNRNHRRVLKQLAQRSAEVLEERALLSASTIESLDGSGNNVANPAWGTAGTDLLRLTPAQYADGISSPSLPNDPSARLISNLVNSQAYSANPSTDLNTIDNRSLSDFGYAFGQFMDHDIDLTQGNGASDPIAVPAGDPIGGPNDAPLAFNRSQTDPKTGTSTSNPAQDVNSITSYFDLSQVYGSDLATDNALRTFVGGQMKTSPGGLPPLDSLKYFTAAQLAAINAPEGGMADNGPLPESDMYVTGDTRGNENVELRALQALFLDNHNRLAAEVQKLNPTWTDEQIFQEARKLNIAQYQSIIYNEWIPAVLGSNALPAYKGYNPNVNASIADEFSTVAFRFGHSLLSGEIGRAGNNGQAVADNIPLSEDFFDPLVLNGQGQPSTTDPLTGLPSSDIGAILKADADGDSQAMDVMAINSVRNELFNEVVPGVGYGEDLIALDIQRARDQGIGSYNELRQALGLKPVTSFAQITSNVQVQQALKTAYGNVNNIDAFEGGLAEDHVPGSDVGQLFQTIMVNQFTRLRDGDRFFYLNQNFTPMEKTLFQQGNSLAKVIEANTNITNLQSDVFLFQASISGAVSLGNRRAEHAPGVPDITVELEDSSGNVLATTTTDRSGNYSFNQLSGPGADPTGQSGVSETGTYTIVLALPSWLAQTTPSPASILISRGGINVSGVNFRVAMDLRGLSDSQQQAAASVLSTNADGNNSTASTTGTQNSQNASSNAATTISSSPMVGAAAASDSAALPSGLLAFLQFLKSSGATGTVDSTNQGAGSSPPHDSTGTLDAVFGRDVFSAISEAPR